MAVQDIIQSIAEKAQSSAHVKTVYGEPVVSGNKSVVPVAKVAYGFGGGGGVRGRAAEEREGKDEGGGGGGGCKVIPLGVVEITDGQTRYIPFSLAPKVAGGLLAGLIFGYLMGRRRRKHES
ncbi:MAG: spore germination protein GerW family protein [Terriglobia bacterium]